MIASLSRWFAAGRNYVQTAKGVRDFVRTPASVDCIGTVKRQLENREAGFLDTFRRVVFDDPSHLSWWTTFAVIAAMIVSAGSSPVIDALGAINVYAFLAGSLMIAVLFWNAARFIRSSRAQALDCGPRVPTKR